MNTDTMRAEIVAIIESKLGYRYSDSKLDAALARGIKEGDVIMTNGQMTVRVEGDKAIARNADGKQIGPEMDLNGPKHAYDCLKMYALRAAQEF